MVENESNIFDFDYPFYSETYRETFQQHFIEYFYFDEIGQETPSRFKQRLKIKFNLIMPYWNKIFVADTLEQRILDNYDVTETYERDVLNNTNATNDSSNKNLASDTPITKTDFEQLDYFSSIVKDIGNNTSIINGDSNETWTRTMKGNIGIQTDADAVIKYWQSLRQIEKEIFQQCDDLFMGVY
jgi:hypothetical protein